MVVKLNHNELLTYPPKCDQVTFARERQAVDLGATGVGAAVYFGSAEAHRQIQEVGEMSAEARRHGLFTVLWAYLRSEACKTPEANYPTAADPTGQANHIGVTLEADIIKQKQQELNGGFTALKFDMTDRRVYSVPTTDHPVDLARWQLVNCFMGRIGLTNSGGASDGSDDLAEAVRTAVINKCAGGTGLILGRKAFQRPFDEGVEIIGAVQDVYLDGSVTIA